MTWNWIDVVILLIVGLNSFNGVRRGMVRSFFGLIGLVLGLFVCLKGTPFIIEMLRQFNLSGMPVFVTAAIIIFVLIYWMVNEIGKHFKMLIVESSFQQFDTLGGLLLGFIKGVVYTLFFLVPLLGNIFASPTLMATYESSTLLGYARPLVYNAQPLVEGVIAQATQQWQTYQEVVPKIIEHDSRWHGPDDSVIENAEPLSNY